MNSDRSPIYEFGPFLIDAQDRLLFKEGEVVPLAPKVFDILLALVEKSGRVLDKDDLMQQIWPDTFVEEGNLARNVSTLRRALGETEEGHQYIETIPRRGYRFIGKVQKVSDEPVLLHERSKVTIEQEEINDSTEIAILAKKKPVWIPVLQMLLVLIIGGVIGFILGKARVKPSQPVFHRLTFRHGNLSTARIANDGQTVVYTATVEGRPPELFATRLGNPESRSFGISANILSISSSGQMAIGLFEGGRTTSLAQLPLIGGEPRKMIAGIYQASWDPEGKNLAIVRASGSKLRIEYPVGKSLYETSAVLSDVRISPKGDRIAFDEFQPNGLHELAVVHVKDGKRQTLTSGWKRMHGLAWAPDGKEVWVTGVQTVPPPALYAVSLSGKMRVVAHLPGKTAIQDITRDGGVLIELDWNHRSMMYRGAEDSQEHDVSWLDGSLARDLSADGKSILFNETLQAGGDSNVIYMRRPDRSAAVRLGEGRALALSPDGNFVLAYDPQIPAPQLMLIPTGTGQTIQLPRGNIVSFTGDGAWLPDQKRILFAGSEANRPPRVYIQEVAGGALPHPILDDVATFGPISSDGKYLAALDTKKRMCMFPIDGGKVVVIESAQPGDLPLRWSNDNSTLYVGRFKELPAKIYRLNIASGAREFWRELTPPDPDWFGAITSGSITPDGQSYVYSYPRVISTLYLVDGWK